MKKKEDKQVYIKKNDHFEPIGVIYEPEWLGEGIWAVMKHTHSREIANIDYLKEEMTIDKLCDLKTPDLATLAGEYKLSEDILNDIDRELYESSDILTQIRMVLIKAESLTSKYKVEDI